MEAYHLMSWRDFSHVYNLRRLRKWHESLSVLATSCSLADSLQQWGSLIAYSV